MSRKSKKYGCPHCENTEGFTEANVLNADASVLNFDREGEPNYAGESEIDWNSQTLDQSTAEPYRCDACGKSFVKPSIVPHTRREKSA
jgi:ribosomal protein L37AE/L43A